MRLLCLTHGNLFDDAEVFGSGPYVAVKSDILIYCTDGEKETARQMYQPNWYGKEKLGTENGCGDCFRSLPSDYWQEGPAIWGGVERQEGLSVKKGAATRQLFQGLVLSEKGFYEIVRSNSDRETIWFWSGKRVRA